MQGQLHRAGMASAVRKTAGMPRFRLLRRSAAPQTVPAAGPFLDRSTLLRELEVAVPAPERLVRWDTATKACPDCAENVARSAGTCRHCGFVLA
jgi:hypothetical protein